MWNFILSALGNAVSVWNSAGKYENARTFPTRSSASNAQDGPYFVRNYVAGVNSLHTAH